MRLEDKYLFVEKYRPQTLDGMVISNKYKSSFLKYIEDKNIPNLFFAGPPGSGKTTVARILVNNIVADPRVDCMTVNGSSDNGISNVRDKIISYLETPPSENSKIKIVFIDEADFLSQHAQAALRRPIEMFSDTGRFIWTMNYKSKIIPPLFSRFVLYEFKSLDTDHVRNYCYKILKSENVNYDENIVNRVISMYGSDVRKIVNALQGMIDSDNSIVNDDESLVNNEFNVRSYVNDICKYCREGNNKGIMDSLNSIQSILNDVELDFISVYTDMFHDTTLPPWAKIVINKYSQSHLTSMIPGLNFSAMCYDIVKAGRELRKLK